MTASALETSRHGRAGGRALAAVSATILVALIGAALGGGAYVVSREWLSYRAEAVFAQADNDGAQRLKALADIQNACGDRCPPRVWLAASATRTQVAATDPSPTHRRALLSRALLDARAAEARDPANGEATLQRAYLTAVLAQSPTAPPVVEALRDTYRKAPFSLRGGWRLIYAGRYWSALDKPLRASVLAEAAWLVEIKPRMRPEIEAAFIDDGARFALALRLNCANRCARSGQQPVSP